MTSKFLSAFLLLSLACYSCQAQSAETSTLPTSTLTDEDYENSDEFISTISSKETTTFDTTTLEPTTTTLILELETNELNSNISTTPEPLTIANVTTPIATGMPISTNNSSTPTNYIKKSFKSRKDHKRKYKRRRTTTPIAVTTTMSTRSARTIPPVDPAVINSIIASGANGQLEPIPGMPPNGGNFGNDRIGI